MKTLLLPSLLVLLILPAAVHGQPGYTFDRIEGHIDLNDAEEEYVITLTCQEDGMEYLEFSPGRPLEASTTSGEPLEVRGLADSVRIFFPEPLEKGEVYSLVLSMGGPETKDLGDHMLYSNALIFPAPVESLVVAVELPNGIFPDIQSHGVACEEGCRCSEGGPCTCEECTTCLTCRLGAWESAASQPPDDIIIDQQGLTLIWQRSLRENERFDIELLLPKKESRLKWYISGGFLIGAIFLSGFFLARRKRESEVARVFLNPDEKCIIDFIKEHGGEVLQQEIWRAQGVCYSRPKVSRIIADLEERGVIEREPYKKTFRVRLKRG